MSCYFSLRHPSYQPIIMSTPWYFKNGERQFGPCDEQAMLNAVNAGNIAANTMIRQGENNNWFRADQIPGLLPPPAPSPISRQQVVNPLPTTTNLEQTSQKPLIFTRRRLLIIFAVLFLGPTVYGFLTDEYVMALFLNVKETFWHHFVLQYFSSGAN